MRMIRSISVYFFTFFFNAAISFLAFSITTYYLDEKELGIVYLYNSTVLLLVPFISVGAQFVLAIDYFKMPPADYRRHFSNGIMVPLISCALFTLLFLLLFYPFQDVVPVNFFFAIVLPLYCFFAVVNDISTALIRNKEKHLLFSGYSIGRNVIEIGLTIFFVVAMGLKWEGRLASGLISLGAAAIFSLLLFRAWKLWTNESSSREIRQVATSGLPFVPERLAVFVMAYSAGFFINYYQSTEDVGLYGAGMQIAFIVNVSIVALMSWFHPYIFKNLADVPNIRNLRKAVFLYSGISAFITLALILALPVLFQLFIGPKFQGGQVYARFLSLGFFFWSIYGLFVGFLLFKKKNRQIMFISILGMLLSLGLNFFNVRQFGALGATYTSMIVYFIMALVMIVLVNKQYNLKKLLFSSLKEEGLAINLVHKSSSTEL